MAKEEWGTKRICPETGKRFYDLNNSPVISPYTGKEILLNKSSLEKTKGSRKNEENLNDICSQMMDVYGLPSGNEKAAMMDSNDMNDDGDRARIKRRR